MSRLASPVETSGQRWQSLFEPIAAEMSAAEDVLRGELRSDDPQVDALVRHAFRLGGKRLRPALLLLAAKSCGQVTRDHVVLAAVVEMIHTATLVHDDVLDDAAVRRHQPTLNAQHTSEVSVLVGDFLFTHAFSLASSLGTTFACRLIGRATNTVCEGELRQIHSRGQFDLSEQQYYSIIDAKTASLCACCCRLGAHYADADEPLELALERYGRLLGLAFQIGDDLLDLVGDEARAGKSLGTDLEQQKPTLPLIHLLATLDAPARQPLLDELSSGGTGARRHLLKLLRDRGALAYARQQARRLAASAREQLAPLPGGPAREVLALLTELVVQREE